MSSELTFIEKAKRDGVASLVGNKFQHRGGFDGCLQELLFESITPDPDTKLAAVTCCLPVTPETANTYGTLHGGAVSTIVDVVGTLALLANQPPGHLRAGVSVELSVSFLRATPLGDSVRAVGRVVKVGKTLGFTDVQIRRVSDGELVALGRHTKAL